MYHYVRNFSNETPFFKFLSSNSFCKQLDYFQSKYKFISKEDFIDIIKLKKKLKKNYIVLTFDDGFKDHYDYVYPELKKRGLWGIFYIPTSIYSKKEILDVHKIHQLLGRIKSEELLKFLNKIIKPNMLVNLNNEEFKTLTYSTQSNDDSTLIFKRILNYHLSYKYRSKILKILTKKFIKKSEKELFNEIYINENCLKIMEDNGMIIGSHGLNHLLMSRLNLKEQEKEILDSFNYLKNEVGLLMNYKTFCYPYGGFHSFNNYTEEILKENRVLFSFNVERRDINIKDIKNRPQALPRYDCNYFPYGKTF